MRITISASSWAKRWLSEDSVTVDIEAGATVAEVITACGIPSTEIGFIMRGNTRVPRCAPVSDGDELLILPVIIGG